MSKKKRKWGKFSASDGKMYYMPKRFREGLVAMWIFGRDNQLISIIKATGD